MLDVLFNVISPVALVAFIGWLWGFFKKPFDAPNIAHIAINIGTPCLVINSLSTSGLQMGALTQMGLGAALCIIAALALGAAAVKALGQPLAVFLPATAFANTGNIGLPLALFAFGEKGLGLAMAYFAVHTVFTFSVGQALAMRRFSVSEIARSPLIWATFLGAALSVTATPLPLPLARALHILGGLTIPIMLLALGVSLAQLKVKSLSHAFFYGALRLIGGFAIGWGVAYLLGFTGVSRGVLVLQSAMPAAVYAYMFAARYDNRPEEVAGLVVISTLLAIAALPVFLWSVM